MEDWGPHIIIYANYGDIIPFNAATAAIRHMRIETKGTRENEIGDFSAMEEIEAKSADTLPQVIDFTCIPYEHRPSTTIHLRISVLTGGDTPPIPPALGSIKRHSKHRLPPNSSPCCPANWATSCP